MITRERVLGVLSANGPSLPVQIKKALGEGDTFMVGAMLSELRSAGKVKVSVVKRGGSPFYFIPEHSARLVDFISELGEKERRAAELLQEKKVLRDGDQDPLIRVCLREIKDYALPLDVKMNGETILFWKWFLLPSADVEKYIRESLTGKKAEEKPVVEETTTENVEEKKEEPVVEEKAEEQKPVEKKNVEEPVVEEQQHIPSPVETTDPFMKQLSGIFTEKKITVVTYDIVRKNGEVDLELIVPTPLGDVPFYAKAKNKKKSNDNDIASAFVQGQLRKLPVMFITTGEVTKKAKEMLGKEFKGLLLVEI